MKTFNFLSYIGTILLGSLNHFSFIFIVTLSFKHLVPIQALLPRSPSFHKLQSSRRTPLNSDFWQIRKQNLIKTTRSFIQSIWNRDKRKHLKNSSGSDWKHHKSLQLRKSNSNLQRILSRASILRGRRNPFFYVKRK